MKKIEIREEPPLLSLARQVRGWADTLINVAGSATDLGLSLAQSRVKNPAKKSAITAAGRQIRQWREAAGLTLTELAEAVGLGDAKLIEQAEGGIFSLPFDVVLRLAGVLAVSYTHLDVYKRQGIDTRSGFRKRSKSSSYCSGSRSVMNRA